MQVMAGEAWTTDERLDDLAKHMDEGFREVRAEMRQQREEIGKVRGEVGEVREELGELRAEVRGLGNRMDERFDSLNRTLQIAFSLIGIVLAGLMGLIGTQL